MVNLLAIEKFLSAAHINYKSMLIFRGAVPKSHPINKNIALKCDRFVNEGEPAVVIVFPIKIKVVEEIRPEFAAAGSHRCWGG